MYRVIGFSVVTGVHRVYRADGVYRVYRVYRVSGVYLGLRLEAL